MSSRPAHLDEETGAVVDLDTDVRLAWLKQRYWIDYPEANLVLDKLEHLLSQPRRPRTPGVLLLGESNNGKSAIAQRFVERHPTDPNPDGDSVVMRVLMIEIPPKPDQGALFDEILTALAQPFRAKDPVTYKRNHVVALLKRIDLRMLIFDELQRLLGSNQQNRRVTMDAMRYLGNTLQIPLVALSTPRGASALATSDEMINRLHPTELKRWQLDSNFRRVLAGFQRRLPLQEPSHLTTVRMAALIHELSDGLLGEVHDLLELATEAALRSSKEHIDETVLRSLPWIPPKQRKQRVDRSSPGL